MERRTSQLEHTLTPQPQRKWVKGYKSSVRCEDSKLIMQAHYVFRVTLLRFMRLLSIVVYKLSALQLIRHDPSKEFRSYF